MYGIILLALKGPLKYEVVDRRVEEACKKSAQMDSGSVLRRVVIFKTTSSSVTDTSFYRSSVLFKTRWSFIPRAVSRHYFFVPHHVEGGGRVLSEVLPVPAGGRRWPSLSSQSARQNGMLSITRREPGPSTSMRGRAMWDWGHASFKRARARARPEGKTMP